MAVLLVCRTVTVHAAVKRGEVFVHELGIDVAARVRHLGQRRRIAGHHQHARRGRGQHEPAGALGMLEREMLRHRAAPGHAHDVAQLDTELVEDLRGGPAHGEGVVGHDRVRAFAGTGHVEHDEAALGQHFGKRGDRLDIGADAVEKQDRRMVRFLAQPPVRNAQRPAASFDHLDRRGQASLVRCAHVCVLQPADGNVSTPP